MAKGYVYRYYERLPATRNNLMEEKMMTYQNDRSAETNNVRGIRSKVECSCALSEYRNGGSGFKSARISKGINYQYGASWNLQPSGLIQVAVTCPLASIFQIVLWVVVIPPQMIKELPTIEDGPRGPGRARNI